MNFLKKLYTCVLVVLIVAGQQHEAVGPNCSLHKLVMNLFLGKHEWQLQYVPCAPGFLHLKWAFFLPLMVTGEILQIKTVCMVENSFTVASWTGSFEVH